MRHNSSLYLFLGCILFVFPPIQQGISGLFTIVIIHVLNQNWTGIIRRADSNRRISPSEGNRLESPLSLSYPPIRSVHHVLAWPITLRWQPWDSGTHLSAGLTSVHPQSLRWFLSTRETPFINLPFSFFPCWFLILHGGTCGSDKVNTSRNSLGGLTPGVDDDDDVFLLCSSVGGRAGPFCAILRSQNKEWKCGDRKYLHWILLILGLIWHNWHRTDV